MAKFLNRGIYRFFPKVVLSVSLLSNKNYADVERFFETVQTLGSWKENLGIINISIFNHEAGDKNRVAHFTFDESSVQLNRVDGNHRLSAADEVGGSENNTEGGGCRSSERQTGFGPFCIAAQASPGL